jgi:DNA-binding transcriptional MerR regulator
VACIARLSTRVTIGAVCRALSVTPRAIRFYEEKGLVRPRRDRLGARTFDGADYRRVQDIVRLRSAGLPLATIRRLLDAEVLLAPQVVLNELLDHRDKLAKQTWALDRAVEEWAIRTTRPDSTSALAR